MICTPCSQRAGWCWADAEQMAAEKLSLALSHHVFSLLLKVGLFIYLLRGPTQLWSGHDGNANARTIRCCLQLWGAVHDQTLIFCCQFSIYHLWPNKAFPPAYCLSSLRLLMKCSNASMEADIDVFFLEFSFFTNSTEDVTRAPETISVKCEG